MAISLRPISSEKKTDGMPCFTDRGTAEVERERGLSHGGSSCDDDHLSAVESVGEVVQLGEAGRDAGHRSVAVLRGLDLVDGGSDRVGERHVVLRLPLASDRVDLSLSIVDEVGDLALARVAHLHDAGAGLDEAAQNGALRDDLGVIAGVGRCRHDAREGVQVVRTAGTGEVARLGQLVGHSDHIGRLAMGVEVEHGLEDDLVLGQVEVDPLDALEDVGHGVLAQQHAPQSALLREQIVGRSAFGSTGLAARCVVAALRCDPQMCDRHDPPLSSGDMPRIDGRPAPRSTAIPPRSPT